MQQWSIIVGLTNDYTSQSLHAQPVTEDVEFVFLYVRNSGVSEALILQIDSADSSGKEGSATSREEADARSVFVGNVIILFLFALPVIFFFS